MSDIESQERQKRPKVLDELVIDDLETVKVIADPLRLRILELFGKPNTVRNVAAELDMIPTRLYYHVRQLEEHGLIRVVETRLVSGIMERKYQVVAKSLCVAKWLLSPGTPEGQANFQAILSGLFEDIQDDVRDSIREGIIQSTDDDDAANRHLSASFSRGHLRLSPQEFVEFRERLEALYEEYIDRPADVWDNPDYQTYTFLSVLFPTSRKITIPAEDDEASADD